MQCLLKDVRISDWISLEWNTDVILKKIEKIIILLFGKMVREILTEDYLFLLIKMTWIDFFIHSISFNLIEWRSNLYSYFITINKESNQNQIIW